MAAIRGPWSLNYRPLNAYLTTCLQKPTPTELEGEALPEPIVDVVELLSDGFLWGVGAERVKVCNEIPLLVTTTSWSKK